MKYLFITSEISNEVPEYNTSSQQLDTPYQTELELALKTWLYQHEYFHLILPSFHQQFKVINLHFGSFNFMPEIPKNFIFL